VEILLYVKTVSTPTPSSHILLFGETCFSACEKKNISDSITNVRLLEPLGARIYHKILFRYAGHLAWRSLDERVTPPLRKATAIKCTEARSAANSNTKLRLVFLLHRAVTENNTLLVGMNPENWAGNRENSAASRQKLFAHWTVSSDAMTSLITSSSGRQWSKCWISLPSISKWLDLSGNCKRGGSISPDRVPSTSNIRTQSPSGESPSSNQHVMFGSFFQDGRPSQYWIG
jgi:hypothetical protein